MGSTQTPIKKIYERLYKKLNKPGDVFTVQSEDYADPILWGEIESGYWLDNEPKLVNQL